MKYLSILSLLLLIACNINFEQTKPNIILIMSDDIGFSDIGCYGSEIKTPNLDKLGYNGLRFTQFYNNARCCPTRASLITGLYPHQAGVGHMMNKRDDKGYRGDLSKNAVTIAEVLGSNGYKTYMSGKWHLTPGGDAKKLANQENWPLQRGFDKFFGTIHGAGSFFDPNSLTSGNTRIPPAKDFYYTDAISDTSVQFINTHDFDDPFFMYVSYTAPHWPLHALEKDIKKYNGVYDDGWDHLRERRLESIKKLGLIEDDVPLSPVSKYKTWDTIPNKEWQAKCMEVYAAMIDNLDQGVGRIVQALEYQKQLENTVIVYLQDNGACAEQFGTYWKPRDEAEFDTIVKPDADYLQTKMIPDFTRNGELIQFGENVNPGTANSYIAYDRMWATASNSPFRMYKHWVQEGGISSPLIVHWPKEIKTPGLIQTPGHLIDVMATFVDIADASYPIEYKGESILPKEGVSLRRLWQDEDLDDRVLFWEHEGNRAVRSGKWKLVSDPDLPYRMKDTTNILPNEYWELFNIEEDRSEVNDLSGEMPDKVDEMAQEWLVWAKRTYVIPKPRK